jgi:hypothetical protein
MTQAAETLNRDCQCTVTDMPGLRRRIDQVTGSSIAQTHPHLFSDMPVFIEPRHFADMRRSIRAIERVVSSRAYRDAVLPGSFPNARREVAHSGAFIGYDFHIGPDGPKLIEINTNAGGAFLNIAAREAQIACCDASTEFLARLPDGRLLESSILAMFRREWQLARGDRPLRSIAIIDDKPEEQFLYPEFLLARRLFESHGIVTHIADLSALKLEGEVVTVDGQAIDLIYNRSTDFYFQSAATHVLRHAYERDLAVITPGPQAHALYANKRNLMLLSDRDRLAELGVGCDEIDVLIRTIPVTREVRSGDESWWTNRKAWFFKPESGFGSRGAYRGDKMTRRVFAEVTRGEYVAQEFTPAGERVRATSTGSESLKVDIRCYAYEGEIQLMAARLYQGQTTNFRTSGGGFAPVYVVG